VTPVTAALRQTRDAGGQRAPRPTPRPYWLRRLVYCAACGRRMPGSWNNHAAYYRCVFISQYAATNKIDHLRAVYLREDRRRPGRPGLLALSCARQACFRAVSSRYSQSMTVVSVP